MIKATTDYVGIRNIFNVILPRRKLEFIINNNKSISTIRIMMDAYNEALLRKKSGGSAQEEISIYI